MKVFNGPDLIILKNQKAGQHSSFFSFNNFSLLRQNFNNHNNNNKNEQTILPPPALALLRHSPFSWPLYRCFPPFSI
jgi:hypothetical protein